MILQLATGSFKGHNRCSSNRYAKEAVKFFIEKVLFRSGKY
jgi:hypothetical protein